MSTIADRLYPPAIAAEIGGINPGTLRVWYSNQDLVIEYSRSKEDRSWHRYSKVDITKISIMRRLVSYGLTVKHAGFVAAGVINKVKTLLAGDFENIVAAFEGVNLWLWKQKDGYWDSVWSDAEGAENKLPDCFIALDVGAIAKDVQDKLTTKNDLSQAAQLWLDDPTF